MSPSQETRPIVQFPCFETGSRWLPGPAQEKHRKRRTRVEQDSDVLGFRNQLQCVTWWCFEQRLRVPYQGPFSLPTPLLALPPYPLLHSPIPLKALDDLPSPLSRGESRLVLKLHNHHHAPLHHRRQGALCRCVQPPPSYTNTLSKPTWYWWYWSHSNRLRFVSPGSRGAVQAARKAGARVSCAQNRRMKEKRGGRREKRGHRRKQGSGSPAFRREGGL